jgi:hypothetical protein
MIERTQTIMNENPQIPQACGELLKAIEQVEPFRRLFFSIPLRSPRAPRFVSEEN